MRRWDPFADSFRLLERFGGRFREGWPFDDDGIDDDGALEAPADVFEDREGLHFEVELPGVLPQDVVVTRTADAIVVEAERRPSRAGGREVRALEGRYGRVQRTFVLPVRARPEHAIAELVHGVLRVFVPRPAASADVSARVEPRVGADPTGGITVH